MRSEVQIFPDPPFGGLRVIASRTLIRARSEAGFWGHSSAGRAPALHAGGRQFDPAWLHQFQDCTRRVEHEGREPSSQQLPTSSKFTIRSSGSTFQSPNTTTISPQIPLDDGSSCPFARSSIYRKVLDRATKPSHRLQFSRR